MDPPRAVTAIAAMINLLELSNNMRDEFDFIWCSIWQFSMMKGLYIFARYFVFFAHYQLFAWGDILEYVSPAIQTKQTVENYVLIRNIQVMLMMWCVDVPLMKRAYLLSGGTRQSLYICYFICLIKTCSDVVVAWMSYSMRMRQGYHSTDSRAPTICSCIFIVTEMFVQGVIFWLASRSPNRMRTPVTIRLAQNGIEPTVLGLSFVANFTIYMLLEDISACVYPIFMMATSLTSCRLILNMQRAFYRKKRICFDYSDSEPSSEDEDL